MKKYFIAAVDHLSNSRSLLVILCIEFVVMISCFSLCYGALSLYEIRSRMYTENNMDNFYYVRSENAEETNGFIKNDIGLDVMSFGYDTGTDADTELILYSASVFKNINILISKGSAIDIDHDYGNAVPCLITSQLAKKYDVGKTYEFKTEDDIAIAKFYICGVIKNDVIFSPNYGFDYDSSCIIAYDPKGFIKKDVGYMEFYAINAAGIDNFENKYAEYISGNIFQPFEYYYKERNTLERNTIMPYVILAITFIALSLTGLISYTAVSLESAKRMIGIQYFCGAKLYQIILIFITKNLLIVTLPAVLSIPVVIALKDSELAQVTLISWRGYIYAVGLCFIGSVISSLMLHFRINRKQIIKTLNSV